MTFSLSTTQESATAVIPEKLLFSITGAVDRKTMILYMKPQMSDEKQHIQKTAVGSVS